MPRVEELLTPQELIDYTKERQTEAYMGELLFPERKTEAMEIKMIKGASDLPVSAHIHAFDTETELGSREGADYSMQDLALIKRKIRLGEKEIIALESPRNDQEEAEMVRKIYSDVDNLVAGVKTRVECLRMEALSTGSFPSMRTASRQALIMESRARIRLIRHGGAVTPLSWRIWMPLWTGL